MHQAEAQLKRDMNKATADEEEFEHEDGKSKAKSATSLEETEQELDNEFASFKQGVQDWKGSPSVDRPSRDFSQGKFGGLPMDSGKILREKGPGSRGKHLKKQQKQNKEEKIREKRQNA